MNKPITRTITLTIRGVQLAELTPISNPKILKVSDWFMAWIPNTIVPIIPRMIKTIPAVLIDNGFYVNTYILVR
jgi:hypothetical protein